VSRVQGPGFRVQGLGLGFRVWGFRACDERFRAYDLGFRIQGC